MKKILAGKGFKLRFNLDAELFLTKKLRNTGIKELVEEIKVKRINQYLNFLKSKFIIVK